jgi:hypothetical protein
MGQIMAEEYPAYLFGIGRSGQGVRFRRFGHDHQRTTWMGAAMIEMTEVRAQPRSPVPLVCAVVGLAALAAAQYNVLRQIAFVGIVDTDVADYVAVAVLVVALLAWHLWPRRSWSVLLIAGSVCALPTPVLWLAKDAYADWMLTPYLVVSSSALPLLLVGTLGAATATWRAGRRGAGAALLGATLAVRPLTNFSVAGLMLEDEFLPVVTLVVLAGTIVGAVVAITTGPAPVEPEPRPDWQVTIGGALAGVTPSIVFNLWPPPEADSAGDAEAYNTVAGQHFLVVGLVVTGIGLLAGAAAGSRVLVSGVAAGLMLGALVGLVWPAAAAMYDMPAGIPALLALGALVAAVFLALWRARLVVGTAGLGVLMASLLVLWSNGRADEEFLGAEVTDVLTPVLLVVAAIAATSTLASLGAGLATPGEAPAAFAGVTAAVTAGVSAVMNYFTFRSPDDVPEAAGTYLPVIAVLAVAVALTVLAHRLWQDRGEHVVGMPVGPR